MSKGWHMLVHECRLFWVAVQFLTRLPVPRWVGEGFQTDWLTGCVRHFPLVGMGVGVFSAGVLWLALWAWPAWVAGVLAVAASVWLTGAFHEDGLADTFDALGGYVPRDRALTIMKDSRIGTYGAVALVLGLGLRIGLVASLASVQPLAAVLALVAAHSMGRTAAVGMMVSLPYAGDAEHAKAKPLALAVPRSHAVVALTWCALVWAALVVVAGHMGVAALSASHWGWAVGGSLLVVLAVRRWLQQRLGGYTGDALGATEQLVEMAVLLALASAMGGGS